MDRDHDHNEHSIAGFSLSIRIDPDQYRAITRRLDEQTAKLDQLLAGMSDEQKAKLASVTAELKASGDQLAAAVAQDSTPNTTP